MPRRFTSLADDQYLPALDSNVKHKLGKFFSYENPTTYDGYMEHEKVLQIEYKDGEILSYFAEQPMPFGLESEIGSGRDIEKTPLNMDQPRMNTAVLTDTAVSTFYSLDMEAGVSQG